MDVLECLPAYVSTTSTRLVLSTESGKKATVNGLVPAGLQRTLASSTLGGGDSGMANRW